MTEERPEVEELADHLRVLANPNRLRLLYELRRPRSVSQIELPPETVADGENPDRAISHQAVRDHLSKLRSIGVLTTERREHKGNILDEYVLNHQRLFALIEELRSLGELRATEPAPQEETIPGDRETPSEMQSGPRFLLVRGQGEGRVFPLRSENLTSDRGWVIGRKQGLAVTLDYDPFVSAENSELLMDGSGFKLINLRSSRNGTLLNFEPLAPGASAEIKHGDIVSVGKTSLVFRTDR